MKKIKLLLMAIFSAIVISSCHPATDDIEKMKMDGYLQRGVMYFNAGGEENIAAAERQFVRAFELDPKNPIVLLRLGEIYYIYYKSHEDKGETEMAGNYWNASYNSYDQLRETKPDWPEPYFGLANLHYGKGQYDEGIKLLKKVLELKAADDIITNAAVHKELGHFYNMQEKFLEALEEFKEYIQLQPNADDAPNVRMMINTIENGIKNTPETPNK